jgi:oxygen-independent coproporphyrinogen III oxidase
MDFTQEKINLKPSRKGFITNYPNFRYWKSENVDNFLSVKPLNIYLHVPFCIQRCDYCYYRTINLKGKKLIESIDNYVNALCKEIEIGAEHFSFQNRPVKTIYMGGGTPTLLNEAQFNKIYETLNKNLNIVDPEFTVEAAPATLTQRKADILKNLGVNRISLGVQSLCDDILKLSNRVETEKKVMRAIEIAKSTNAFVNIDLLSGLSGETDETWDYSVKHALATGVESITIYKMELYANTEYFKDIRKDKIVLPSDEQEITFMKYAIKEMEKANYKPWSFFTFTKDGNYAHVQAPLIWRGADCYSFGVSSFGHLNNALYQNTNELDKYLAFIEDNKLPVVRGYMLSSLEQMVRTIQLGMKLLTLDLNDFQQKFGFRLDSICRSILEQLVEEDYITLTEEKIELTAKGFLYGDFVGKTLSNSLLNIFKE